MNESVWAMPIILLGGILGMVIGFWQVEKMYHREDVERVEYYGFGQIPPPPKFWRFVWRLWWGHEE